MVYVRVCERERGYVCVCEREHEGVCACMRAFLCECV